MIRIKFRNNADHLGLPLAGLMVSGDPLILTVYSLSPYPFVKIMGWNPKLISSQSFFYANNVC